MNILYKWLFKKLTKVKKIKWIAVSERIKLKMKELPHDFGEISIIPAYIPPVFSHDAKLPDNLQKFINKNDKVISIYGNSFLKYKGKDVYGYETAIDLLNELSNKGVKVGLVIFIAQMNDQQNLELLKDKVRRLGLTEYVYWQFEVFEQAWLLWSLSSIYLRPTSTDGDSVAVREALAVGVPVVASDVVKRPGGVVKYPYGDLRALTESVYSILLENKLERKFEFEYENYEKQVEIYNEIIDL